MPTHGGTDPGASGNGIIEKEYTLLISQYMEERLKSMGIEVSMTRTDDSTLDPTDRTNKVQSFYGTGSDVVVVSNHINAGGGDGAEVIYALRNDDVLSEAIGAGFVSVGQNYRTSYQRRLPSDSSLDYYYMHRNTPNNETIIVEYGFLDSTGDDVSQIKNSWKTLTEAVLMALVPYIGGTYIPLDTNYIYIVKSGDTLYSIAQANNTTVDKLKELNLITSDSLTIGQTIYLPGIEDSTSETYTVKSGDTLYSIASKYNLTVSELKELNNLTSDSLTIGQVLNVKSENTNSNADIPQTYIVKSGDTLYSISSTYGVSVAKIIQLNSLSSEVLTIGQVLILSDADGGSPEIEDELVETYTVVSGDSLYSIASKFNTTVNKLKELNGLTSDNLSIGQILIVADVSLDDDQSLDTEDYVVVSGDTLYKIATKYNMSVAELSELNKLTSEVLTIGQILKVQKLTSDNSENDKDDSSSEEYETYIVKSGDTLYSIAKKYGITYTELMELNSLTSNLLSLGQSLIVPNSNYGYMFYTVKSGDSLYKIALNYGTTVNAIKELNNLTSDLLSIGQELLIP